MSKKYTQNATGDGKTKDSEMNGSKL